LTGSKQTLSLLTLADTTPTEHSDNVKKNNLRKYTKRGHIYKQLIKGQFVEHSMPTRHLWCPHRTTVQTQDQIIQQGVILLCKQC